VHIEYFSQGNLNEKISTMWQTKKHIQKNNGLKKYESCTDGDEKYYDEKMTNDLILLKTGI